MRSLQNSCYPELNQAEIFTQLPFATASTACERRPACADGFAKIDDVPFSWTRAAPAPADGCDYHLFLQPPTPHDYFDSDHASYCPFGPMR